MIGLSASSIARSKVVRAVRVGWERGGTRATSPGWSLGNTENAAKGQLTEGRASTGQKNPFNFQRQELSYTNAN